MRKLVEQLAGESTGPITIGLQSVAIPDLWQQQAVSALRAGKDVVVQAPTGSGKTLIFELWSNFGRNRGQAIYTVPTRALANDKLAEWRARGWDVGIATGDLAENLSAPIIVATLETQKIRLIQGDGPALLVVDEYQMIADEDRGLNYELALALAPPETQLLLLSGSVANPHHIVQWLNRLERQAVLVRYEHRPVPLEEVSAGQLSWHLPPEIKGYWPRLCAKALAENLGPILLFAPRRQNAEELAVELSRQLPCPEPLALSDAQKKLVGDPLAKMLKSRIAYHHSGLSYGARAGVIEPLAKAGQLRVVVATMGLAAGINFSLRSVAVTQATYRRDGVEFPLRPDEILQMHGRAGRRGLDETGYVLISANDLRLHDGHAAQLSRSGMVDWSTLLTLMSVAADRGKDPFAEAVRVQERLFTSKPIFLGVEQSLRNPVTPCGLKTDAERARHVRRRVREMFNSRGEWQPYSVSEERALKDIWVFQPATETAPEPPIPAQAESNSTIENSPPTSVPRIRGDAAVDPHRTSSSSSQDVDNGDNASPLTFTFSVPPSPGWVPVLTVPAALEKVGVGGLMVIGESLYGRVWGRAVVVAERLAKGQLLLAKWVRRLTVWTGRQSSYDNWKKELEPRIVEALKSQQLQVTRFVHHSHNISAWVNLEDQKLRIPIDQHGVAIWRPREREVFPEDCSRCHCREECRQLTTATGTAFLWRRLNLVDAQGIPTRRGRIVSYFSSNDGLAIAAAIEDRSYPLDELVYDLANLDAGFRFCADEHRWGGHLAVACRQAYGLQNIQGYLENGIPPKYGDGANVVVQAVHKDPLCKYRFATQRLGDGDIDRVIIEWRSVLRRVSHAPHLEWARWTDFQQLAKSILNETESPTMTHLPTLEYHQTKRMEHRLTLRRH